MIKTLERVFAVVVCAAVMFIFLIMLIVGVISAVSIADKILTLLGFK